MLTAHPPETTRFHGGSCGPKLVRSSSGHEYQQALALPSPAASNTVVINARCSLRIEADQRVIRRGWTAGAHYRAEDCGRRGLCDGVPGGVGVRPANGTWRGRLTDLVRTVRRHQARYVQGGNGGARSRGRLASRSATALRATSTQHRAAESQGMSKPGGRARLGVSEKGDSQADRTFDARRERTACVRRDDGRSGGGAAGGGVPSAKSTDD